MPPIVSIVGRSESGKTTLIEKLIPELRRRGYRMEPSNTPTMRLKSTKPGKTAPGTGLPARKPLFSPPRANRHGQDH
jgi:GTPase SAR1 family protein